MDLQTFVSKTLIQVMKGVDDARYQYTSTDPLPGVISPQYEPGPGQTPIFAIEFDVAVTVIEEGEKKGGIGVVGGIIALGGQVHAANKQESVSRIRFKVPVQLPGSSTTG